MTSLYPATSATSRAGIASATQGRRPAFHSRITAASIIRRSARGSAILPNSDSTCQRRATQPSIWSVTAAPPKTIAAAQLCPPSELRISAMKTGIIASRAIVKALGIHRMLKGYGGDGDPLVAGVRQRAQPRLPARLAGAHRGRGLLGLARVDAGPGPRTVPEQVRTGYVQVYREMLAAGYTAVGEFHYLGLREAHAAVEAAAEAGIEIVLLYAAYGRGGIERVRQESPAEYLEQLEAIRTTGVRVGLAPHSVRACSRDWLELIGLYASREGLPLHVHADEQPKEIEECIAEHGLRPIELLAETGCLGPRTTIVHATHADGRELDLLRQTGSRICICPITEANLGDGFLPVERVLHRGIGMCIGSDSNVRIDPLEELRELDGIARRQAGRRDVLTVDELLEIGSSGGAAVLGLQSWPEVAVG